MSVFRLFSFNSLANCRSVLSSRAALICCEEQKASITHKALEKLGIPIPPKKPLSPYIRFAQEIRPKIIQNEPDIKPTDVLKRIAYEWQQCDPEKKKSLQKEYLMEMESYIVTNEKYKGTITPEQQNLLQSVKEKKKRAKALSRLNEKKESLGKPKKPITAFLKFMLEKKADRDESIKYSTWLSGIAKEWEQMPEGIKEEYKKHGEQELQRYRSDLLVWEESMLRQGHIDVVRNKELLDKTPKKKPDVNTV